MADVTPVGVPTCYRHSDRETYVRCVRCDRSICPDCMREASVGFQCPDCVAAGQRDQRPTRTAFGASTAGVAGRVTISLIAVNVLMLMLSAASTRNPMAALIGQGIGGSSTPLTDRLSVIGAGQIPGTGALVPMGVATGEYYRLITAMFLHYGLLHLGMNMWALWVLGRSLEAALGPWRFLALYLLAGIGGNVAAYVWQPAAATAGASTAIFGLFAAIFLALRRLGRSTSAVVPVIVINLVFTIAVPGISIAGHLGGLVTGAIVGGGMVYAPARRRRAVQVATAVGTLVALALLVVVKTASLRSGA